jgi:hypothetical protein
VPPLTANEKQRVPLPRTSPPRDSRLTEIEYFEEEIVKEYVDCRSIGKYSPVTNRHNPIQ